MIEEIAYRDTWGKGVDSFMAMIYERLKLMHGLLAEDGSIFIHCDGRVNSYMRLVLDEIFGKDNFLNEIIWCYRDLGGGVIMISIRENTIRYFGIQNLVNTKLMRLPEASCQRKQ